MLEGKAYPQNLQSEPLLPPSEAEPLKLARWKSLPSILGRQNDCMNPHVETGQSLASSVPSRSSSQRQPRKKLPGMRCGLTAFQETSKTVSWVLDGTGVRKGAGCCMSKLLVQTVSDQFGVMNPDYRKISKKSVEPTSTELGWTKVDSNKLSSGNSANTATETHTCKSRRFSTTVQYRTDGNASPRSRHPIRSSSHCPVSSAAASEGTPQASEE